VEFFGSLICKVMSSTNMDFSTTSLPICIPFISSCCHIALARSCRTMLNRRGENGHPYLSPDFRGNGSSFSPLIMMLAIGLSYIALIMFRYIHSIPSFLRAFIMKWYFFLPKTFFSCVYWDDQVVFVFASVNMVYYVYWFSYVESSLHPRDEAHLVMVNDLFDMLLYSVCHYFIEDFCINAH
jgi:hypothetical protein